MYIDVDLFPFILLGARWALSSEIHSFSPAYELFFNYFFQYFSPSHRSCSLFKELIYTDVKTVMYFPYLSFSFNFSRYIHIYTFFFFCFMHTEFLLFSSNSTTQSSFMLNCYLAHPLNFFFIIFNILSGSLPFFSAIMINQCNMLLNLKWNTNYIFSLKFSSEL